MLHVEGARLESWHPQLEDTGSSNPVWTRVWSAGELICNSLEWAVWHTNPVQVVLCSECGTPGCAPGGHVHVSRLSGQGILWTVHGIADQPDATQPVGTLGPVHDHGLVFLPQDEWRRWRRRVPSLPDQASFRPMTARVLADAWRFALVGPLGGAELRDLPGLAAEHTVASDTLSPLEVASAMMAMVRWLEDAGDSALEGEIVRAGDVGARVERLHLADGGLPPCPAIAQLDGGVLPVLGSDWVFMPHGRRPQWRSSPAR